jgi:hypothetical protein
MYLIITEFSLACNMSLDLSSLPTPHDTARARETLEFAKKFRAFLANY